MKHRDIFTEKMETGAHFKNRINPKYQINRKYFAIPILFISLIICGFNANAQSWPPEGMKGNGQANSPWEIETAEHLKALSDYVASADNVSNGKYYKLMNDVDLSIYTNWKSIGYYVYNYDWGTSTYYPFRGNFDGNGKIVRNLNKTIDYGGHYGGFFGPILNAKIENLGIENCHISGPFMDAIGGLAGECENSIISNCYVTGNINEKSYGKVGGLIGSSTDDSVITNCYAEVNIVSSEYGAIGGLIGNNDGSTISNCYATGNVNGDYNVGGLVGKNHNSLISNCYATGNTSGKGYNIGGLAGCNENSTISNCYATGNVAGEGYCIGGLVGINSEDCMISYCYASGIINGGGRYVAGLVGENNGTVRNCVAANATVYTSSSATTINRITGNNSTGCANNYAFADMVVANSGGYVTIIDGLPFAGTGKDMATLQSLSFYTAQGNWDSASWDIDAEDAVWKICDGKGLPFLRWEGIDCGTGISELESAKIKIYPNPTADIFVVECDGARLIKLYDMLGKEVLTHHANGKTEVSLRALPKGIYNIRIFSEGKVVGSSKIVKL